MSDTRRIQEGFGQLARHFADAGAHDPDPADPKGRLVSPAELFRSIEQLPEPAASLAQALLSEPRRTYEALRGLEREGAFNDPQVSLRDLHAAARGSSYRGAPLGEPGEALYRGVSAQVRLVHRLGEARPIERIADPVWREIARGVDRDHGNNDGWFAVDQHGLAQTEEPRAIAEAIARYEGYQGLSEALLAEAVSERHQSAMAALERRALVERERRITPPVLEVPIDALSDVAVRAYAREVTRGAAALPLTYDAAGKPTGALAILADAVRARTGGFPAPDAWLLDRDGLRQRSELVERFLAGLPPSALFDFTRHGIFAEVFAGEQALTPAAARQANRGRSFSDVFVSSAGEVRPRMRVEVDATRPGFPARLAALGAALEQGGVSSVPVAQIVALAEARYRRAQARGEIGAVYDAQHMMGAQALEGFRTFVVDAATQRRIDALFSSTGAQLGSLSAVELEAVRSGRLTRDEIAELRAIRAATQIFEAATDLRHDSGGWTGNLRSEGLGEYGQTNCLQEAHTYMLFLQQLEARGLLRHFAPSGRVRKTTTQMDLRGRLVPTALETRWDTLHAGVLMVRRRSGDYYVLDSWVESGGQPAHIVRLHDWLRGDYTLSTTGVARPTR